MGRGRLVGVAAPGRGVMLTYYSASAREDFWTEHWGGHSVDELLAVARVSPLTALITGALPAAGLVLEAGCGLGQYVILLRERASRARAAGSRTGQGRSPPPARGRPPAGRR